VTLSERRCLRSFSEKPISMRAFLSFLPETVEIAVCTPEIAEGGMCRMGGRGRGGEGALGGWAAMGME
jgi:hypothetical protein